MEIFDLREFDAHEQVVFGHDAATGMRAIIAIHSTTLGPAAGGCRMWPYATTAEAVADVLRLSRGMSYKNAMANLKFGGGKAVIIADAKKSKSPELFEAFGRFVDSLGGRYVTAEDVGTTTADMASVARATRYVAGLGRAPGEAGGDPGPKTALGVYLGIKAAVKFRLGRDELSGLSVAVQGVGGVGYHLCRMLAADGARLFVADVRPAAVQRVVEEFKASALRRGGHPGGGRGRARPVRAGRGAQCRQLPAPAGARGGRGGEQPAGAGPGRHGAVRRPASCTRRTMSSTPAASSRSPASTTAGPPRRRSSPISRASRCA